MTARDGFETRAIHAGQDPDATTGAVVPPISLATTFAQDAVGVHRGYEYARSGNPTRTALESCLAALEGAGNGIAFASGLAAEDALLRTLSPGDHVIMPTDAYGGTFRLIARVYERFGLDWSAVDVGDPDELAAAWRPETRMVWIETPTNPALSIVDIAAVAKSAHAQRARVVVDNTFATPYLQEPLALGADAVVHSSTKYLGGHSDVIGGFVATHDAELADEVRFLQNAMGAVPSPFDCYLVLRGVKTLAIRMDRHCENARAIVACLQAHDAVERVLYPGLPEHPRHEVAAAQMRDFGGIVSFTLAGGENAALDVVGRTRLFTLAESLGAVESLIEHPGADDPCVGRRISPGSGSRAGAAVGRHRNRGRSRRRHDPGARLLGVVMNRREFILAAAGAPLLLAAVPGEGSPYGELHAADANGFMLPRRLHVALIATAVQPVAATGFVWHVFPDGGATFPTDDGGWIYVSNSELLNNGGGVGAVRFAADASHRRRVWDLHRYEHELRGRRDTMGHVAHVRRGRRGPGVGVRPHRRGAQRSCAPRSDGSGTRRSRAMPTIARCTSPRTPTAAGSTGSRRHAGRICPTVCSKPRSPTKPVRSRGSPSDDERATTYAGGEGIAFHAGKVVFTTKSDQRIREYDVRNARMRVLHEPGQEPEVVGPDNIAFSTNGDLYVCEDTEHEQDLVLIGADGSKSQVLHCVGHDDSELAGAAFDPSGTRLYLSSQRGGGGGGSTYEITGPFRQLAAETAASTTTTLGGTSVRRPDTTGGAEADEFPMVPVVGAAGLAAVAVVGGLAWWRHHRGTAET